ncbi:MAG: C25 family cysteine peptidase [Planctomycetota bacterium]
MLRFSLAVLTMFAFSTFTNAPEAQDVRDVPKTDVPVDYLIVYAGDFNDVAAEWARHRIASGRVAETLEYAKVNEVPSLDALKAHITKLHESAPSLQVLLIGDCPDFGSKKVDLATQIPWKMSSYKDAALRAPKSVPSDNFLANTVKDKQGKPDLAIGRIPAQTVEQAELALAKVKLYESSKSGEWMRDLTFFAGEGRFGAIVDSMIEGLFTQFVDMAVDQAYDVRMTYANINSSYAYVPSQFSAKVLQEANKGGLLLTYIGHGMYDRLDNMQVKIGDETKRYPILAKADVAKFDIKDGKLPVMVIIACQTGYMDHKEGCLAEAVLFKENAPVAVISSSRDSHPYSNIIFQKSLTETIVGDAVTIGDAFLAAKRELVEAKDPQRMTLDMMALAQFPSKEDRDRINEAHLRLYNLTGDPGLVLRKSNAQVFVAKGDKGPELTKKISVKAESEFEIAIRLAPKMCVQFKDGAKVEGIRIELCRMRSAKAASLQTLKKEDLYSADEDKRKIAQEVMIANHAAANDKVVSDTKFTLKAAFVGEDDSTVIYTVKLGPGVAPGDYILKVFALDAESDSVALTSTPLKVRRKR